MGEIFSPGLVTVALFIGVVLIVRSVLAYLRSRRESTVQLQLHTRLIDKFGTPAELVDYLRSDAGRAFLMPPAVEQGMPYRRILASAQAGIVLSFVGGAMWMLRGTDSLGREGYPAVMALGTILVALGLGFIASAVLAYVLSSRWGLLDGKRSPNDEIQ